jgi:glycosylphosphatidylinositol transamidase (GPIT) subunit GPI8
MVKSFAAAMLPAVVAAREHWAVIVAGSNTYSNYRHQADACHAYQIAKTNGVPEDHIILMAYDDIASSSQNPFPGQLFNKPDPTGPGYDVYAGCNIDYKGADVTPQMFMDVMTGKASGKKLESTAEDNVFVFFSDHGAPGLIAFPGSAGTLHKAELQSTFQTMSDNKMFNKLTFYLETCESGSMFEDMSIPGIYALSASNPTESSWGSYCGSEAQVNGKSINSCLGDLFSVSWMEDADAVDTTQESLEENFQTVKTATTRSEVMQWGDVTYTDDKMSEFIGNLDPSLKASASEDRKGLVNARQIDLNRLYSMYTAATTSAERLQIGQELQQELQQQLAVDQIHEKFLGLVYPGDDAKQEAMRTGKARPSLLDCEARVHRAFETHAAPHYVVNSGFALQFHQIVVNVCADFAQSNGPVSQLEGAVKDACSQGIIV